MSTAGEPAPPPARPSLRGLILTLPPALTLVAAIGSFLSFGTLGEWLIANWTSVTRELWELALPALRLPDDVKDYLTAIVFFAPAGLVALRRRPVAGESGVRVAAFLLGIAMGVLLAGAAVDDYPAFVGRMLDAGGLVVLVILYPVLALSLAVLAVVIPRRAMGLLRSGGGRYGKANITPPLRPGAVAIVTVSALGASILAVTALVSEVASLWSSGFVVDLGAQDMEALQGPHPARLLVTVVLVMILFIVPANGSMRGRTMERISKVPLPANGGKKVGRNIPFVLTLIGFYFPGVMGVIVATWTVGLVRALLMAALFALVWVTALCLPRRMIEIALTVVILIAAAYAERVIGVIAASLEALGAG